MMTMKGILASLAGPAPNYDMQRILATRNPREACLMSGMVNVVLLLPSYVMSTGIVVLALAFCMPDLRAMATPDFEKLLPMVMSRYVPTGMLGILLAGLIAAFMSNFAATLNAAPAYLVNDIYKRFLNPGVSGRAEVNLTRVTSLVILAAGNPLRPHHRPHHRCHDVARRGALQRIRDRQRPEVVLVALQRIRVFLGHGFRDRQRSDCSLVAKRLYGDDINMIYTFPAIFAISTIFSVLGALWSKPDDDEVLVHFYSTVRPWGAWGRIRDLVLREDPGFKVNRDCARNWVNVAVGIVWQLCLVTLPTYLVLRSWTGFWISLVILVATSVFMKINWYNRLMKEPEETLQEFPAETVLT